VSANEIWPVAWVSDDGRPFRTENEARRNSWNGATALYDQQSIDCLTAERDAAVAERDADKAELARHRRDAELYVLITHDEANQWEQAEKDRDEAQRKLSVAVAEGKGLVAAAARARRCLAWACEQRPEFNEEYEALDAAIDAARTEGQR